MRPKISRKLVPCNVLFSNYSPFYQTQHSLNQYFYEKNSNFIFILASRSKMRRVLVILLILITRDSYAQKQSGHSVSKVTPAIEARINRLNRISDSILLRTPDSARKLAENALLLAQKYGYAAGEAQSFYNIGHVYWAQSYYAISLFYLNSALKYLPKDKPLDAADYYMATGRTYADLQNYNQALHCLDTASHYAGADVGARAEVYGERAYVYCALKQYDRALMAATRSLQLEKGLGVHLNIAILYGRLAAIYTGKKNYATALKYDDTAYTMSIQTVNRRLRAKTLAEYAYINNELKNFDLAINYAQKCIALADSIGFVDARTLAYKQLINSFELKGNLKQALVYQKKYNFLQDSLSAAEKLKTTQLIKNYFEFSSRMNNAVLIELNDQENKAKIKSQQELILILISSLFIVTVILFATYYFYKQKKMLSNKLQEQHKALLDQKHLIELQTANLEMANNLKDKLLTVIAHDLRTPIANLSNMVEMFEGGDLSASDVNGLMKNINPIVKGAEFTLYNLLEWAGNQVKGKGIHASNVDVFLLGVEMEQTFKHALQQKNIEFINSAYPGQSVTADENHLKVILRNLVSNAIKFTAENGTVTLSTVVENKGLIISVSDNGRGMTADELDKLFHIHTHFSHEGTYGELGTGIGLLLCKELVELNGGKLKVESAPGKGSTFYFNLPLIKAYA